MGAEQDDTRELDEYLLDHSDGCAFSPVVQPEVLKRAVARGWVEEVSPRWFRVSRIGKLRLRLLHKQRAAEVT